MAHAPSRAAPLHPPSRLVAYERVSTRRQGASGLGLEAQRAAIEGFAKSRAADVLARFTEIESGRVSDRPELTKALHLANPNGAEALRLAGKGGAPLRAAIARNADAHARDLARVLADIRAGGHTSLRAIAAELDARGILIRRGGMWHLSNVRNLLAPLEGFRAEET